MIFQPAPSPTGWNTLDISTIAQPNTTVGSASNGIATSTFTGSATLTVASTTGFPSAGILRVINAGVVSYVTYTAIGSSTTFSNCRLIAGTAVTMATSDVVRYQGFTLTGAFAKIFIKGKKLRYTDSTVKYGVVGKHSSTGAGAVEESGTTFVPIIPTTTYVPTAAPTVLAHSNVAQPDAWPDWFSLPPIILSPGFSSLPTSIQQRWKCDNKTFMVYQNHLTAGTSDSTAYTATIPITAQTITFGHYGGAMSRTTDNTSTIASGKWVIASAGEIVTFYKDATEAAWTTSGTKSLRTGVMIYEI